MNFSNILNNLPPQITNNFGNVKNNIPGGLAGGAVAGGIVALLLGNKSVRKTATTAAKYGGAAMLGGLAYKAYSNWQKNNIGPVNSKATNTPHHTLNQTNTSKQNEYVTNNNLQHDNYFDQTASSDEFQLSIVKAMIASARADGSIDTKEQKNISDAIDSMNLDTKTKNELFELFISPISIEDITRELDTVEKKSEIYLASCLAIDLDDHREYVHLSNLSRALGLPPGLESQLRSTAMQTVSK